MSAVSETYLYLHAVISQDTSTWCSHPAPVMELKRRLASLAPDRTGYVKIEVNEVLDRSCSLGCSIVIKASGPRYWSNSPQLKLFKSKTLC